MKIQYAPLNQKLNDTNGNLTNIWMTWIRNLATTLSDASKNVILDSKCSYNVNCSILTINFIGQSEPYTITLPYEIAVDCILPYWIYENDIWVYKFSEVSKGAKYITLPSGNIKINSQLLITQK